MVGTGGTLVPSRSISRLSFGSHRPKSKKQQSHLYTPHLRHNVSQLKLTKLGVVWKFWNQTHNGWPLLYDWLTFWTTLNTFFIIILLISWNISFYSLDSAESHFANFRYFWKMGLADTSAAAQFFCGRTRNVICPRFSDLWNVTSQCWNFSSEKFYWIWL